ncbi:MAG: translocation/assembly module TamB domain-containing protein, partial [Ferruginibacter sp.]
FDISSSNDLNGQYKNLQTAANVNISKKILNGRVILTVGGNVDVNNPYSYKNNNSNLLVTPDFTAEFLLTNDGKLRVVAFRRTNTDFALGQRNRQGLSLTYRNDFDNVKELFESKKKRAKKKAVKN